MIGLCLALLMAPVGVEGPGRPELVNLRHITFAQFYKEVKIEGNKRHVYKVRFTGNSRISVFYMDVEDVYRRSKECK